MPITPNFHYCRLGAMGWDYAAWNGVFYPEDLPVDWRLNYYSTQFECVYLPYAAWHATPLETLQEWHHTTLEQFRFLLEPPPSPNIDAALIAALGEKALLVPQRGPTLLWFDRDTPLKQLAQSLQALEQASSIYLLSTSGDFTQLEQVQTLLEVMGY